MILLALCNFRDTSLPLVPSNHTLMVYIKAFIFWMVKNNANRQLKLFRVHRVLNVWTHPYRQSNPLYGHSLLCIFFQPPTFDIFLGNIIPLKKRSKKKWTHEKSYFFMFKRLQDNVTCIFMNNTFTSHTRLQFDQKQ